MMCFIVYSINDKDVKWCKFLDPFWDLKKLISEFCYDQLNLYIVDMELYEIRELLKKDYNLHFDVYYLRNILGR